MKCWKPILELHWQPDTDTSSNKKITQWHTTKPLKTRTQLPSLCIRALHTLSGWIGDSTIQTCDISWPCVAISRNFPWFYTKIIHHNSSQTWLFVAAHNYKCTIAGIHIITIHSSFAVSDFSDSVKSKQHFVNLLGIYLNVTAVHLFVYCSFEQWSLYHILSSVHCVSAAVIHSSFSTMSTTIHNKYCMFTGQFSAKSFHHKCHCLGEKT